MTQKELEITEQKKLLDEKGHLVQPGWARQLVLGYDRKAIKAGATRIKEWDYYQIMGPGYGLALTIDDNSYMALDSISVLDFRGHRVESAEEVWADRRKGDRRSGVDRRSGIDRRGEERACAGRRVDEEGRRKGEDRRHDEEGYFDRKGWEVTKSPMKFFTMGKRNFPKSSVSGDVEAKGKGYELSFKNPGNMQRELTFRMENFATGHVDADGMFCPGEGPSFAVEGKITLTQKEGDTIVLSTPFNAKETAFYYNQKINCLAADGYAHLIGSDGSRAVFEFNSDNSFAVLDWGRGVWTYKNTWYWGSASGLLDGKRFGFNLGYGFGDNPATENIVFYDGVGHKLSQVTFNIPKKSDVFTTRGSCCGTQAGDKIETGEMVEDFMSPWTFTSDDGRFEMDFVPVLDRASNTDFKILGSDQHQVFGYYSGHVTLDDGTVLEVKDLLGFAEKVMNKW